MMRISNFNYSDIPEHYREETKYLVECCARQGLIVSPQEAYSAWSAYSDSMAAGWLGTAYPDEAYTQEDCDKQNTGIIEYYGKYNL